MSFDAEQLCNDFNIDYAKSGKHQRQGWINISCPLCSGHSGYHGGFEIQQGYYNCHRCGYTSLNKIIAILTGSNYHVTKTIVKKYTTDTEHLTQQKQQINQPPKLTLPMDIQKLTKKAKKYLINRKYNPNKLQSEWNLFSTSHIGFYKNRILAPIYQNGQLVSYQCRDITNRHPQKYLACFQNQEVIQHQKCIYGLNNAIQNDTCIVVEGITDTWRLGYGAIATFGISFTKQQAQLIAQNFKHVFIMFDSEDQAQEKASELGFLISSAFKNNIEIINLSFIGQDIDPGELLQDDADMLMKEIGLK